MKRELIIVGSLSMKQAPSSASLSIVYRSSSVVRPVKRIVLSIIIALAFASTALSQSATVEQSKNGKAEREILQIIDEWLDALKRGDIPALERIIAEDYLITVSDGRVLNREQDLEPLRTGGKFLSASTEDVRVRVFKDTAVVTGKGSYKVSFNERVFDVSERFTDVYVKRHGHWQPVASHSTTLKK